MARTYDNYIWTKAIEELDADELQQAANSALASMLPWEADMVRRAMDVPQKEIRYFGPGSAAELFMALGLWLKEQEL